jgi:hypothetical protein
MFLYPLGLKDFEEWLLFVEGCPENLSVPRYASILYLASTLMPSQLFHPLAKGVYVTL